jgi:hypothetical protein
VSDASTHWGNCYAFGREHYDCLLAEASRRGDEVKRLREALTKIASDGCGEDWYVPYGQACPGCPSCRAKDALAGAAEVKHE